MNEFEIKMLKSLEDIKENQLNIIEILIEIKKFYGVDDTII